MPAAFDVARHLIYLAAAEEEPDYLTHLRLQKLLYYVQGWSLAQRGEPMFDSRIEAWAHGPVVRDLYGAFSGYGFQPIPPGGFGDDGSSLTPEDQNFIESVWQVYKGFSANKLREMTHQEAPWRDARGDLHPAERCDVEITWEAMRAYFSQQAE